MACAPEAIVSARFRNCSEFDRRWTDGPPTRPTRRVPGNSAHDLPNARAARSFERAATHATSAGEAELLKGWNHHARRDDVERRRRPVGGTGGERRRCVQDVAGRD